MRHFIQLLHVLFWSTKPPTSRESAMRWGFLRFRNPRNRSISVLQNRLEQFHRVASFDFWHHRNLRTFRTWRESGLHRGFYISLRAQVCVSHWRQRGHLGGGEPKSKGSRSAYPRNVGWGVTSTLIGGRGYLTIGCLLQCPNFWTRGVHIARSVQMLWWSHRSLHMSSSMLFCMAKHRRNDSLWFTLWTSFAPAFECKLHAWHLPNVGRVGLVRCFIYIYI